MSCSPTHLPPSRSILCFSLGSSGLWSCVISSSWSLISESFSCTPTTTAESPTWATYMWTPRITITLAVVPDVLGRPVTVFGHSAVKGKRSIKRKNDCYSLIIMVKVCEGNTVGSISKGSNTMPKCWYIVHYEKLAMIHHLILKPQHAGYKNTTGVVLFFYFLQGISSSLKPIYHKIW